MHTIVQSGQNLVHGHDSHLRSDFRQYTYHVSESGYNEVDLEAVIAAAYSDASDSKLHFTRILRSNIMIMSIAVASQTWHIMVQHVMVQHAEILQISVESSYVHIRTRSGIS